MAKAGFFLRKIGPGPFAGVRLSDWLRLLRDNRFEVSPPYWIRAALVTAMSVKNSILGRIEEWRYGQLVRQTKLHPPIFVLGVWRSGTTHLHNLLSLDSRFCFLNTYQAFFPHAFLTTERFHARMFDRVFPKRRFQDNVTMGADQPMEDEFPLLIATGLSFMLAYTFPRRADAYGRHLAFEGASTDDVERWKSTLKLVLQKLTYLHDRPVVLKSPGHLARLPLLLDLFPNARFIMIHRNPYEVHQSTEHTVRSLAEMWAMQRQDVANLCEQSIAFYRTAVEAFCRHKHLIPSEQYTELAYLELEDNPLGTLQRVYQELNLPAFSEVEPRIRAYLDSIRGYQRNRFVPLDEQLKARLAQEWKAGFDEWNYDLESGEWLGPELSTSNPYDS